MILIGENIHIVSKKVRQALEERDEVFIKELIKKQIKMDYIDFNIGPAKGKISGAMSWLTKIKESENKNIGISFDTSNFEEIKSGYHIVSNKNKTFINSTNIDDVNIYEKINIAKENDSNIIALTMSKETGIPKTSDGRLEISFNLYEKFLEKEIKTENLFFDPLVIPITADQSQAKEALDTIKMIKESFEPQVKTIIGLSNISNGCPQNIRPIINRTYAVMAKGAGLDAAIIDAGDAELVRILKMLETKKPQKNIDELYLNIASSIENFEETENIEYNESDKEQKIVMKAVNILSNKEVYSNSFTQI